jgi:hypothetical protein
MKAELKDGAKSNYFSIEIGRFGDNLTETHIRKCWHGGLRCFGLWRATGKHANQRDNQYQHGRRSHMIFDTPEIKMFRRTAELTRRRDFIQPSPQQV